MALSDYRWGGAACVCMHGVSASMCLCERGIEARWWGHSMTCDDYGGGAKDDVREYVVRNEVCHTFCMEDVILVVWKWFSI